MPAATLPSSGDERDGRRARAIGRRAARTSGSRRRRIASARPKPIRPAVSQSTSTRLAPSSSSTCCSCVYRDPAKQRRPDPAAARAGYRQRRARAIAAMRRAPIGTLLSTLVSRRAPLRPGPTSIVDVDRVAADQAAAVRRQVDPGRRAGVPGIEQLERAGGDRARQHRRSANALELKRSGSWPDADAGTEKSELRSRKQASILTSAFNVSVLTSFRS